MKNQLNKAKVGTQIKYIKYYPLSNESEILGVLAAVEESEESYNETTLQSVRTQDELDAALYECKTSGFGGLVIIYGHDEKHFHFGDSSRAPKDRLIV